MSPNTIAVGVVEEKSTRDLNIETMKNVVYYSTDFGTTWKAKNLRSRYGNFGDPAMIADNRGFFYYFHLADPEKTGWDSDVLLDRIVCQRFNVNSTLWSPGSGIGHNPPKQQDKQWAAFDEHSGRIFVTWTQFDRYGSEDVQDSSHIMFSYSEDRGNSWTPAARINQLGGDCRDGDQTVQGSMPAAGPGGALYVVWAANEKIFFDHSPDGGVQWQPRDTEIAQQKGGWVIDVPGMNTVKSFPVIGCDLSYGEYHGNIYVNWADQRNGESDTDIWIIRSEDGGDTWSKPLRVHDDEKTLGGRQQFMNWMAVDPVTGFVYIVFYDRREHDSTETDVYLAYSSDGGRSFVNEKISASPFIPDSDVFLGDYIGISAYAGTVRPVWTRLDNDVISVVMALID
jgi:hypothetical protein